MEKSYKLNYKNILWIIITTISIGLFIGMTLAVMRDGNNVQSYDLTAFRIFGGITNHTNTIIFSVISFFGSPGITLILTFIVGGLLWFENKQMQALALVLLQVSGDVLAFMIKEIVRRPRPGKQLVIDTGFSFPSGHMFSASLLGLTIIVFLLSKIKASSKRFVSNILIIMWMLLVGAARIYLRDHYFSDVLASLLLAIGYTGIFNFLFNCIRNKFKMDTFGGK